MAGTPSVSHAETTVTWDFRKPEAVMPLVEGLTTVERTPEGLHIQTFQDGLIGWQNAPIPKTDAVYVYARNAQSAEAAFMWQPVGAAQGTLLQLFFTSPKSDTFEKTGIVPTDYDEWSEKTPVVAFGFPAGTDMTIQKIEWKSWGAGEKLAAMLKSMWAFDTVSQYSINFLWGPLFTANPETLATLYDGLPPKGVSAMRGVYALLLLATIASWVLSALGDRRHAVLTVIWAVAGFWLLLDLRMGSELLTYAVTDIRSYVFPGSDTPRLRTLGDVPAMTAKANALLEGRHPSSIVLLEPAGNAYVAHTRLKLYPLDVASYSEALKASPNRAWLVLHRPDISVNDGIVTTEAGRTLSSKGTVLERFGDDSFLFLEQ